MKILKEDMVGRFLLRWRSFLEDRIRNQCEWRSLDDHSRMYHIPLLQRLMRIHQEDRLGSIRRLGRMFLGHRVCNRFGWRSLQYQDRMHHIHMLRALR